jgi:hypothetical protein
MTSEATSVSFEPTTAEELRRFFHANKDKYHEIWIIITKKTSADPQPVSFKDAVAEAVKLGLIDSRTKTLSEPKYAIRFTKRKRTKPS